MILKSGSSLCSSASFTCIVNPPFPLFLSVFGSLKYALTVCVLVAVMPSRSMISSAQLVILLVTIYLKSESPAPLSTNSAHFSTGHLSPTCNDESPLVMLRFEENCGELESLRGVSLILIVTISSRVFHVCGSAILTFTLCSPGFFVSIAPSQVVLRGIVSFFVPDRVALSAISFDPFITDTRAPLVPHLIGIFIGCPFSISKVLSICKASSFISTHILKSNGADPGIRHFGSIITA